MAIETPPDQQLTEESFGVRLARMKQEAQKNSHWETVRALTLVESAYQRDVENEKAE